MQQAAQGGAGASGAQHRTRWIATPPQDPTGHTRPTAHRPGPGAASGRRRYTGPPFYPVPPRWGFPPLAWRRPTAIPGTPTATPVAAQRLLLIARNAVAVLWTLAGLAAVAAGAEAWRYVLLVLSRNTALNPATVGVSDALVLVFSLLTFVATVFAIAVTLWWLFVARTAAADEAGHQPPRPAWQVAVGVLVPGVNLVLAGSILAELEHAATRQPAHRRPRPSRLVLGWWVAWVLNAVLLVLTVAWRARDGVQAQADAVLLTALTDASAVLLAVLTARIVRRFTLLLAPLDERTVRPLRVVGVQGAPEPPRRARPATAVR